MSTEPTVVDNTASYIGVYVSDDMKARKSCEVELVFGETKPSGEGFNFKYVTLPCPNCMFPHLFKRSYWCENAKFHGT